MQQTNVLSGWKARIDAAMQAAKGKKVDRFATSLKDRHVANLPYHEHSGQPVEIVGLFIEPGKPPVGFDEEALPYFKGRFDDGLEMQIGVEELFTQDPALRELIAAVCSGFAVARDMGYVGPYHLAEEGKSSDHEQFERDVLAFESLKNWTSKPACCPYCGGRDIQEIVEWEATSTQDDDNTCRQTEYQCDGACEGRSFWS